MRFRSVGLLTVTSSPIASTFLFMVSVLVIIAHFHFKEDHKFTLFGSVMTLRGSEILGQSIEMKVGGAAEGSVR